MVDKLKAIKRERAGAKIASASPEQLEDIERAVIDLLGLGTDRYRSLDPPDRALPQNEGQGRRPGSPLG